MSLFLIGAAAAALACGPDFPNSFFIEGDAALLRAPVLEFQRELDRVLEPPCDRAVLAEQNDYRKETLEAELADLGEALGKTSLPAERRATLLEQYEALRNAAIPLPDGPGPPNAVPDLPDQEIWPAGWPIEFRDYLQGAIAFHAGRTNAAERAWQTLLNRPPDRRHYRSTWAAFMLGKINLDRNPAKAVAFFRQVRALRSSGFADRIGLATASLGWEARAELERGRWPAAIDLYLAQAVAGDPSAVSSLRFVAEKICAQGEERLAEIVQYPNARRVLTAYFVSRAALPKDEGERPLRGWSQDWLATVERAGIRRIDFADRLALQAYQTGEFDLAKKWLEKAGPESLIGLWVKAKLALRDGDCAAATESLSRLCRHFPIGRDGQAGSGRDPFWLPRARGEWGVLRLARGEFTEALDQLLRGGYWIDAAYVAERVLTTDELFRYAEAFWPEVGGARKPEFVPFGQVAPGEVGSKLRYLLARRLAREKRWGEAKKFLPPALRDGFDQFTGALELGRDPTKPLAARARGLWQAAELLRHWGMEWTGSEADPDWRVYDGAYADAPIAWMRSRTNAVFGEELPPFSFLRDGAGGAYRLIASTAEERDRLRAHPVEPEERFHYRSQAADLAWQAAQLMPNNSDQTAVVLCTAGSWLKTRNPKAADRFYKALVRRCPKTAIGRAAERLRWFPVLDQNGKVIPIKRKAPDNARPGDLPPEPAPFFPPLADFGSPQQPVIH